MADIKHGVVRTDKMYGTDTGVNLVSAKYFTTVNSKEVETEIDNGNVLKVGNLLEGEREVRKATTPAANTALKEIILVATPEVMYDEHKKALHEFYNEAGAILRGYFLHEHDYFSLTADALTIAAGAEVAVGWAVELMAGTKMKVVATATNGSTQVGKIAAIEQSGRYTYYVVEVA